MMRTDDRPMPKCLGCDEYLTMDEIQGEAHRCRISSGDLPVMVIALAQARYLGDAWEVETDGKGFVVFNDPMEARDMLKAVNTHRPTTPTPGGVDHG